MKHCRYERNGNLREPELHLLAVYLRTSVHLREGLRLRQRELQLLALHLRTQLFLRYRLSLRLSRWPSRRSAILTAVVATAACHVVAAPAVVALPDYPDDTSSCVGADLHSCQLGEQLHEVVGAGERLVTEYITQFGIADDSLPRLVYVRSGTSASSRCVDVYGQATQRDRSYNYCLTDNTVYIGQQTLRDFYQRYGPWGPISGIAHEYGHFLQAARQVPTPGNARETIRSENQADCVSGAFVGFQAARGTIENPGDVDRVKQYLAATASVEAPGRDHGTAGERIDSFELGYRGALEACSQFFPATPLTR